MSINYVCGVFTSWKQLSSNNLILHFAINRFVGKDLIHYDLPSNNTNKANKKRVSLYIDLQTNEDLNKIENLNSKDQYFVNLPREYMDDYKKLKLRHNSNIKSK